MRTEEEECTKQKAAEEENTFTFVNGKISQAFSLSLCVCLSLCPSHYRRLSSKSSFAIGISSINSSIRAGTVCQNAVA